LTNQPFRFPQRTPNKSCRTADRNAHRHVSRNNAAVPHRSHARLRIVSRLSVIAEIIYQDYWFLQY
jgi:hypothetical protein